jgi:hypothetical protein
MVIECIFDGCKSGITTTQTGGEGSGGGIVLFWKEVAQVLLFSHLFFVNCNSFRGPIDITFRNADSMNWGYGTTEVFYLSRSQSSFVNLNKLIIGYEGDGGGDDKSCLLPPYLRSPVYVASSNGTEFKVVNRQYCGLEEVRCPTISFIDDALDPTHDYVINMEDGNYEEWKLTSHSSVIRDIRGNSMALTIIKVVNKNEYVNPMFFIPTTSVSSTLTLSSLTFSLSTTYSLLKVEGNGAILKMKDLLIRVRNVAEKRTANIIEFIDGSSISLVRFKFNNVLSEVSA